MIASSVVRQIIGTTTIADTATGTRSDTSAIRRISAKEVIGVVLITVLRG